MNSSLILIGGKDKVIRCESCKEISMKMVSQDLYDVTMHHCKTVGYGTKLLVRDGNQIWIDKDGRAFVIR